MLARVRLSEQRSRQVIDKIKKQFLEEVIQIIRTTPGISPCFWRYF
jgi:ribosomal protein L22